MSASRSTSRPRIRPSLSAASRDPLPLVPAVVHGHVALAAGLGPLDRPAESAGDQHGQHLFGRDLQLGSEAAADVGRDDPDVLLRDAGDQGQHDPEHVRDLGRGPEREFTADARADHRARLHRGRDQPLLAVGALKHDRRVTEGRVHVAVGKDPLEALVARLVNLGRALIQRGPDVEHRRELLRSRSRSRPARRPPRSGHGPPRRPPPRRRNVPRRSPSADAPE